MTNYSSLTALFTGIADAIRAKTGGTAQISADAFPTAIAAIPAGLTMGVATYTPSSNTTSVSFSVDGEPQYFCCHSVKQPYYEQSSTSYFMTVSVWYDGTTVYSYRMSTSGYIYCYSDRHTQTYNSTTGKLTLADPTTGASNQKSYFMSGVPYQLIYFY